MNKFDRNGEKPEEGTRETPGNDFPMQITGDEFKKLTDSGEDFILVDIRKESEYEENHFDGAVNIIRRRVRKERETLEPSKRIVLYCGSGFDSLNSAFMLRQSGFPKAQSLKGGIDGYNTN